MKLAAILIAALALAPAVHAQATQEKAACAAYEKIIAAQAKGFEPIKGKAKLPDGVSVIVSIPGAGLCHVSEAKYGAIYSCSMEFKTVNEAKTSALAAIAQARACLPQWKEQTRTFEAIADAGGPFAPLVSTTLHPGAPALGFDFVLVRQRIDGKISFLVDQTIVWRR